MEKQYESQGTFVGIIAENIKVDTVCRTGVLCKTFLQVYRKSGVTDTFMLIATQQMLQDAGIKKGAKVYVEGEVQTRNEYGVNKKRHVCVFVRVSKIYEVQEDVQDQNEIVMRGVLCKAPKFEQKYSGKKKAEFILAKKDKIGDTSSYIPCIMWNELAEMVCELPVGSKLNFIGRLQSRKYIKRFATGEEEERTAYEVSGMRLI